MVCFHDGRLQLQQPTLHAALYETVKHLEEPQQAVTKFIQLQFAENKVQHVFMSYKTILRQTDRKAVTIR